MSYVHSTPGPPVPQQTLFGRSQLLGRESVHQNPFDSVTGPQDEHRPKYPGGWFSSVGIRHRVFYRSGRPVRCTFGVGYHDLSVVRRSRVQLRPPELLVRSCRPLVGIRSPRRRTVSWTGLPRTPSWFTFGRTRVPPTTLSSTLRQIPIAR